MRFATSIFRAQIRCLRTQRRRFVAMTRCLVTQILGGAHEAALKANALMKDVLKCAFRPTSISPGESVWQADAWRNPLACRQFAESILANPSFLAIGQA